MEEKSSVYIYFSLYSLTQKTYFENQKMKYFLFMTDITFPSDKSLWNSSKMFSVSKKVKKLQKRLFKKISLPNLLG